MRASGQNIKQIWDFMVKTPGRYDHVMRNIQLISAGEGKCQCKFKIEKEHTNVGGTIHGGFTATLVDTISTMALLATEPHAPGVSVDLSVSYMRAAPIGEEVTVDAKAIKIGKTLAFLTVDLTDTKGRLIAQGKHTKFTAEQGLSNHFDSNSSTQ